MSTPTQYPTHQASETIASYPEDTRARAVKFFRNGANQAVRIPKDFELHGTDAVMHCEGNRLILELVLDKPKRGTVAASATALISMKDWPGVDEPFPDPDDRLAPLDEIDP